MISEDFKEQAFEAQRWRWRASASPPSSLSCKREQRSARRSLRRSRPWRGKSDRHWPATCRARPRCPRRGGLGIAKPAKQRLGCLENAALVSFAALPWLRCSSRISADEVMKLNTSSSRFRQAVSLTFAELEGKAHGLRDLVDARPGLQPTGRGSPGSIKIPLCVVSRGRPAASWSPSPS